MANHARLIGAALFFLAPTLSFAHSGGLNSEGCHNDRKNGTYHCHRGTSAPAPLADFGSSVGGEAYYPNCAAARAAGAAPIYYGEPGYRGRLDRDGDGVACE